MIISIGNIDVKFQIGILYINLNKDGGQRGMVWWKKNEKTVGFSVTPVTSPGF